MKVFKDKVAIVTGGASGIGRELCIELAKAGAKVYVADIKEEETRNTVSTITSFGGKAEGIITDMTDREAVKSLVDKVTAQGPLDYMFNNAGIIMFGEFRDMEYSDWEHFIDSDVMSVIYGTRCAYEVMIRQGHGHIVNTSSVFGLFPFALSTGYTAVKSAITGLSMALRPEAADFGVKVSVACPGSVDTDVKKSYRVINADRELFNSYIPKQLTPRQAALRILKGVQKNQGIIAFPWYDVLPWWLYRLSPSVNTIWQRKLVKIYREKCRFG